MSDLVMKTAEEIKEIEEYKRTFEKEYELDHTLNNLEKRFIELWHKMQDKANLSPQERVEMEEVEDEITRMEEQRYQFQRSLLRSGKANSYTFSYKCACGLEFSLYSWDRQWHRNHQPRCPECGKREMRTVWIKPTMKHIHEINPMGL